MRFCLKSNIKLLILLQLFALYSCSSNKKVIMSQHSTHVFRLKPGEDLKKSIQEYINNNKIKAGWMVTCVGSLTDYNIRMANQSNPSSGNGHFEIVSLNGTLSENGSHMHISFSDSTGKTIGGHLMEGCRVYTTAEIVIQSSDEYIFKRENDGTTPWEELKIKKAKDKN